jgi:hypothetical protein
MEVIVIKLFYWQYSLLKMLGSQPCEEYHSGFTKALSELDVPDGAEIQEGYFLTKAELEEREREAFEAAEEGKWDCSEFYPTFDTFEDYKKSRGEG